MLQASIITVSQLSYEGRTMGRDLKMIVTVKEKEYPELYSELSKTNSREKAFKIKFLASEYVKGSVRGLQYHLERSSIPANSDKKTMRPGQERLQKTLEVVGQIDKDLENF